MAPHCTTAHTTMKMLRRITEKAEDNMLFSAEEKKGAIFNSSRG